MAKKRPHDFCSECGSDLGPIPPPPPRCHHCRGALKGHKGPWGVGRCRNAMPDSIAVKCDAFFKSTVEAYGKALDKMMMEDHPAVLSMLAKEKR